MVFSPDPYIAAERSMLGKIPGEVLEIVPYGTTLGPSDPW